jgi:glycosyltransferase involved in cell wall biosynthesis
MPRASVSVIMPSYNCGRFIAEAIDSILKQTLAPEQIIIVDDGSTDDTEQVVRRYADERIEYIKQRNAGVSAARNTGLDAARCEFVTFLDADDRWRPTFVERMHGLLAAAPAAVCAFANFVRFQHATGEVLRDQFHYYRELSGQDATRSIPRERAFSTLVGCGEVPAYTQVMMFRRGPIESIRFDTDLALCEDANFALKTFLQGDVVFTREILAEVRRHDTNATRDFREMAVHKVRALTALAPHVTRDLDLAAYRDRMVKAHVDAALYLTSVGRIRAGLSSYLQSLRVPGSPMRKVKASVRMALALPGGLRGATTQLRQRRNQVPARS